MIRRLWTFFLWYFGPRQTPHRWVCKECGRTWDTARAERPDECERIVYGRILPPPPDPNDGRWPAHLREVAARSSDGYRMRSVRCGPVVYEGRFIHPLDYKRHGIDASPALEAHEIYAGDGR